MPRAFPPVSAVIVSYRDEESVVRCVRSVLATSYPQLRITVVDNASGEETVEAIRRRCPECRIVVNTANLGFGRACNVGLEIAIADAAEFLLVLNQDTVVDPSLVERLVDFMKEHPRAGAVAPKTLSSRTLPGGGPMRLYAGAWRGVLPLIQNIPGIEREDAILPDVPIRTDYAWGHGMMLRASAVAEVGLFDPAFFMYCEDLDLCLRLRDAGFEVWCEPRALMWHDVSDGARADRSEFWRWACKVESNRIFHRKRFGRWAYPFLDVATVLVEAKRLLHRRRFLAAAHLLGAYGRSLLPRTGRPSVSTSTARRTGSG